MSSLFGGIAECGPSNNPLNSLNKMFNQDNNSLNKQVRPPLPPVKRNIIADHHCLFNRITVIQQVRALMEYDSLNLSPANKLFADLIHRFNHRDSDSNNSSPTIMSKPTTSINSSSSSHNDLSI
jgi:hypothetical protein